MGTGTMGRPDDSVPRRSDHIDPRRGLQGCGLWQEAAATSQEGALKAYLSAETQSVWKMILLSRRLRNAAIQKDWYLEWLDYIPGSVWLVPHLGVSTL